MSNIRTRVGLCVGACALVLACGQVHGALSATAIALTGRTDALGPNQGTLTFTQVNNSLPTINADGMIVFRAQNSAMPVNGDTSLGALNSGTGGVFVWSGGTNSLRAQIGDPTPDALTYTYGPSSGGFTTTQIADGGTIAYGNSQTGATASAGAYFVQSPGAALINRQATLAPGGGGATFSLTSAGSMALNNFGGYAISGALAGTGVINTSGDANRNDSAVWTGSNGSLSMLYRRNMALDGLTGGVKPDGTPTTFAGARIGDFAIGSTTGAYNGNGHLIWRGQNLQGSTIITTSNSPLNNSAAIFSNVSGSLQAIARGGDMAFGTAPADNTTYGGFSTVAINNQDRYAFSVGLRAGTATTTTSTLYSNHVNGGLQMLARQGTATPASLAFPAGTLWGNFSSSMVLGGGNHLLFNTSSMTGPSITTSTNNALVMCKPDGSFANIARIRTELVPAISPVAGENTLVSNFGSYGVNSQGQVAFTATIVGSLATGSGIVAAQNNFALFACDELGVTRLVAQSGTAFEVAPGDVRIVAPNVANALGSVLSLTLGSGGQDGRGSSLNDSGLLTFALRFTDGSSGVFYTQIPAPGAAALLGFGGLIAARRRRN